MDSNCCISRRTALGATAAATTLPLAACGGSDDSAGGTSSIKHPEVTAPIDMIAADEVPVGSAVKAVAEGVVLMIAQPTEGQFIAYSSNCTHQGCVLNVQNNLLACPCHASQFALADGSVTGGPALDTLPSYPTKVEGGRVIVG
ncbi:Rieske (2Fe-2S) protein [Rothia sp. ZJ932]|uniref:Rieske (2Fe-2S) protein n=1 Tax=Rothia sp. ZJ932 TaxID=2810516 RepID=UPI001968A0C7|nr:Rieske (2Fe-2S) protein [Rothia sp. ZJ932]QRZ60874.1 Rieske (2Fe-2S) protein [Rothia sp. ZJ932]